jgi:membrane protein implicated in regulation of membrane protease activity
MFNNSVIWLLLALSFLLFEMGHPGLFFFLSFACGSALTAVAAYLVHDTGAQLAVFIASSIGAMVLIKRYVPVMSRHVATNGDALNGKRVVVSTSISPDQPGAVKIDGTVWTAYSGDAGIYAIGTIVSIQRVRGAHVLVKSAHNSSLLPKDIL